LLRAYPEKLGSRTLSYSEAVRASSLDELRNKLIDDEIDSKMRASHLEQLEYLSSLANVGLGTDESNLIANFVEITERRNCHIHSSGNISTQYLRICSTHKVSFQQTPVVGKPLEVTAGYFAEARRVLSEMAFKISQTIVRKVFPDYQSEANDQVNVVGIELLAEERWNEALAVFDYLSGLRLDRNKYESDWKNNLINKAQTLIGMGKTDAATKLIDEIDWTASHPKYLMAVQVLKREYEEAAELMPAANLEAENYRGWPLFRDFRQSDCFKQSFSKLFGHEFDQAMEGEVKEALALVDANNAESESASEGASVAEMPAVEDVPGAL
jgi:hypothetical protein